jgi:DNA-binding protein HU-beta
MATSSPRAMTKTQLTTLLAGKINTTKVEVGKYLEQLSEIAIRETKKNGIFVLPGIGRLVKSHRAARTGRNPQNGETIQIKARTVVKFRVAKAVKDAISPPTSKATSKAA